MRHCTVLEYFLEPLESLESENFWFANKTLRGLEALEWLRASSQCAYRAGSFSSTPPLSPTGRFSWPWAVNDVINHANAMKLLKHTHSHTQTHAHTYTHVHIYTHMCKHAHTHKDTQTHIHTCTQYTHLYTHTHRQGLEEITDSWTGGGSQNMTYPFPQTWFCATFPSN